MTESLFETIRYGIAVVLLAVLPAARGRRAWPPLAAGLVSGTLLAFLYAMRDLRTPVEPVVMIAAALLLVAQLLPGSLVGSRSLGITWSGAVFLLAAQRSAALITFVVGRSQDRVDVLNSDFLLFHAGTLVGVALLVIAGTMLARLAAGRDVRLAAAAAIALLALEGVCWGYYALVLHGWFSLPDRLFTFVGSVINHVRVFGYGQMALAAAIGIWCHLRRERPRAEAVAELSPAARRSYLFRMRRQWLYGAAFLCAAGTATAGGFYYKLYASRPPSLTPAEHVEAKEGRIAVPVQGFAKEELHRYAYTPKEGREIRFIAFMDENGRIRATYDACLMCGDKGYLKRGKELICLACGAAIYAPTVGREGGCNPIPLDYKVEKGNLVVELDALLHGHGAEAFGHSGESTR